MSEPFTLRIQGRDLALSVITVDPKYSSQRNVWSGKNLSVVQYLDGREQAWTISLSGPWYDDSDPEAHGKTLEEVVNNMEKEIQKWVSHLTNCGE